MRHCLEGKVGLLGEAVDASALCVVHGNATLRLLHIHDAQCRQEERGEVHQQVAVVLLRCLHCHPKPPLAHQTQPAARHTVRLTDSCAVLSHIEVLNRTEGHSLIQNIRNRLKSCRVGFVTRFHPSSVSTADLMRCRLHGSRCAVNMMSAIISLQNQYSSMRPVHKT